MLGGSRSLLVARFLTYGASGVAVVLLTRILGPDDYGVYATGGSVAAVALMLSYFGQEQVYLAGAISLDQLRGRNVDATVLSLALLFAGCLLWPSVGWSVRLCGILIGVGVLASRLLLPYLAEPSARLDFGARARREIVVLATVPLGAVAIGVTFGATPILFAGGYAVAAAVPAAVALASGSSSRPETDRRLRLNALRVGLPFAVSNALYLVYFQSDVAIVGALSTSTEVGLYSAACSVVSVAIVASSVLMNDVMRARLYKHAKGSRAFAAVARRASVSAVVLGILAGGCAVFAAPLIVDVLFGASYGGSIDLLRILGIAIALYYLSNWASNVLIGAGSAGLVVRVQLLLAVSNVALNVALVPLWGAKGSAWITVGCEAVGLCIYFGLLRVRTVLRYDRVAIGAGGS
jgi:O-antigen/teichoic acid export membrane protein